MENSIIERNPDLDLPDNYSEYLTPEQLRQVEHLKSIIDIHDKRKVNELGREQQASVAQLYDMVLKDAKTHEIGEAGDFLADTVVKIRGYATDYEKPGILKFLKKQQAKVKYLQSRYRKVSKNIEIITEQLQRNYNKLQRFSDFFDDMFQRNLDTFNFLEMVIFAAEEVLKEERQKLEVLKKEAEESGRPMVLQQVSDFNGDIDYFESKLLGLKTSRMRAIQQAPMIRNHQKNSDILASAIDMVINEGISEWKKVMADSIGMQVHEGSLNAVNQVRDSINQMLIANSERNKQLTIQTAQIAGRGLIDIETIQKINQNLIETIQEACKAVDDVRIKRKSDEKELLKCEEELKSAIANYSKRV